MALHKSGSGGHSDLGTFRAWCHAGTRNRDFVLHRNGTTFDGDEPTQRSRGFVYLSLGAATMLMAGASSLSIYEYGLGAINLPYTAAQLGFQGTRATNPVALDAMSDFITLATERRVIMRLPFLGSTKGELVGHLKHSAVASHLGYTVSCDGFPQRVPERPQCGVCTSCILRRQAVFEAGLQRHDASERYRFDVNGSTAALPRSRRHHLQAMQDQVFALQRALACENPWYGLSEAFPQLEEVAATSTAARTLHGDSKGAIIRMYRQYCEEWWRFVGQSTAGFDALGA